MGKLKVEDLHLVLKKVFEIGYEMEYSLGVSIRQTSGVEKTVLDITYQEEKNHKKPIMKRRIHPRTGRQTEYIDGYEEEPRWRVHFAYINEAEGDIHHGLSYALDADNESDVIEQSIRISRELQTVYELPYTPQIYRDGKLVA